MGAFDYVMTETRNEAYMAEFTPEQLEFFYGFPAWMIALGFPVAFLVMAFQCFHLVFRELAGDAPPTGSAPETEWGDSPEVSP